MENRECQLFKTIFNIKIGNSLPKIGPKHKKIKTPFDNLSEKTNFLAASPITNLPV